MKGYAIYKGSKYRHKSYINMPKKNHITSIDSFEIPFDNKNSVTLDL